MEIVCMDALEYIETFNNESFDLVILDPDYQDWNKLIDKGIIEKVMEKLKPTGNVLCFTKQPFDYQLRMAVNPYFRREIVWTFENGGAWCSPKMPLISSQKIYWLVKTKDFFFNPRTGVEYKESTKNFTRTKKVFGDYEVAGRQFEKHVDGIWLRDHLHYNKPNSGKIPAKPEELIKILLRCFCPIGGNVLDPFSGSGVVPLTAEQMNMNVYASEIQESRVMKILDRSFQCEADIEYGTGQGGV